MLLFLLFLFFFFSSRRRHTRCSRDWSSDVCSSDLRSAGGTVRPGRASGRPTSRRRGSRSRRRRRADLPAGRTASADRKSTRLNSSHGYISYAVFCLKKKKKITLYTAWVVAAKFSVE